MPTFTASNDRSETPPPVKLARGTKVLLRKRVKDVLIACRCTVANDYHHSSFYVLDESNPIYIGEEGKSWVRGWTGKVATAFTRAIRAEAAKEAHEKRAHEKKRYEESVKHAVERMRFAADAVKRAKLPARYRSIAFAALLSPPPYVSLTPFLR